jgi:hypothetical protein
MDHTEVTINHNAGKSFAISASMVIASAILWGLYGTFVTILTSMGLSRNALVFLRMLGTSIPVGLLICATDRKAFRVRKADIPLSSVTACSACSSSPSVIQPRSKSPK